MLKKKSLLLFFLIVWRPIKVFSFFNPKPRQSLGASAYLCQTSRLDRRWPRHQLTAVTFFFFITTHFIQFFKKDTNKITYINILLCGVNVPTFGLYDFEKIKIC
jgi:hypothetical protein